MISSSHSAAVLVLPLLVCLTFISSAKGCSPMPPGQGRTVNFTVSGFTLPASMAYSADTAAQTTVPQISKTPDAAMALVSNLIMEAVIAVLEQQGRSALLPSFVISAILDQLTVAVNYMPLNCPKVYTTTGAQAAGMNGECFIINGIVTSLCMANNCNPSTGAMLRQIPPEHMSIRGSVTTTNLIMAGWSNQMWQSVFSRALQMVRQGPFGTNFAASFVSVM